MTYISVWIRAVVFNFFWLVCFSPAFAADKQQKVKIRYPNLVGESIYAYQLDYFVDVLKIALEKSASNYEIEFVDIPDLSQTRSQILINQKVYDIHWLATSIEREKELKPIRIPLYRGLLGLRIAFVNNGKYDLFAHATDITPLKKFFVGQGRDWVDTKILNFHKFKIVEASTTQDLFEMLQINRMDYFPRSVVEIWWESEQSMTSGLRIEPHIALYYPETVYFFVRNDSAELHDLVLQGLNLAISDGRFQENFERYFGETLKRAQLDKRKIFRLNNPFLPPETPLEDKRLWHDLTFE